MCHLSDFYLKASRYTTTCCEKQLSKHKSDFMNQEDRVSKPPFSALCLRRGLKHGAVSCFAGIRLACLCVQYIFALRVPAAHVWQVTPVDPEDPAVRTLAGYALHHRVIHARGARTWGETYLLPPTPRRRRRRHN